MRREMEGKLEDKGRKERAEMEYWKERRMTVSKGRAHFSYLFHLDRFVENILKLVRGFSIYRQNSLLHKWFKKAPNKQYLGVI